MHGAGAVWCACVLVAAGSTAGQAPAASAVPSGLANGSAVEPKTALPAKQDPAQTHRAAPPTGAPQTQEPLAAPPDEDDEMPWWKLAVIVFLAFVVGLTCAAIVWWAMSKRGEDASPAHHEPLLGQGSYAPPDRARDASASLPPPPPPPNDMWSPQPPAPPPAGPAGGGAPYPPLGTEEAYGHVHYEPYPSTDDPGRHWPPQGTEARGMDVVQYYPFAPGADAASTRQPSAYTEQAQQPYAYPTDAASTRQPSMRTEHALPMDPVSPYSAASHALMQRGPSPARTRPDSPSGSLYIKKEGSPESPQRVDGVGDMAGYLDASFAQASPQHAPPPLPPLSPMSSVSDQMDSAFSRATVQPRRAGPPPQRPRSASPYAHGEDAFSFAPPLPPSRPGARHVTVPLGARGRSPSDDRPSSQGSSVLPTPYSFSAAPPGRGRPAPFPPHRIAAGRAPHMYPDFHTSPVNDIDPRI